VHRRHGIAALEREYDGAVGEQRRLVHDALRALSGVLNGGSHFGARSERAESDLDDAKTTVLVSRLPRSKIGASTLGRRRGSFDRDAPVGLRGGSFRHVRYIDSLRRARYVQTSMQFL